MRKRLILTSYIKGILSKYAPFKKEAFIQSVLNDNRAIFSSFGHDIYMSDIVNNCIDRIATEISKIDVRSVVENGSSIAVQNDDISRLFRNRPNPLQTSKDFLAACVWLQRKTMHCFIYPQWELVRSPNGQTARRYTALWPLNPSSVEIGRDEAGTRWMVRFYWREGGYDTLPYADVIHLKWRRGKNVIIGGGDDNGRADTKDTLQAVGVLDKMLQGLPLSIESSLKLNGVFTSKTVSDADALRRARDKFEDRIIQSKLGIAAIDIAGDFQPIQSKQAVISEPTMKFVKDIIRNRYGVSTAILDGDYNDAQHAAFYQSCLEDFITEFEQAATACLFTTREQDVGHRIRCYYNKVEYYDTANKMQLAQIARDTGLMTLNQVADMFGIEPFEGGDRRLQSLNYVNTELVDKYQLDAKGVKQDGDKKDGSAES